MKPKDKLKELKLSNKYSLQEFLFIKKKLNEQSSLKVKIISGSMEPLIMTGEEVVLESFQGDLVPYETYVYLNEENNLICHYFWKKSLLEPGHLLFRALLSSQSDHLVKKEFVLGKVKNKRVGWWQQLTSLVKIHLKK